MMQEESRKVDFAAISALIVCGVWSAWFMAPISVIGLSLIAISLALWRSRRRVAVALGQVAALLNFIGASLTLAPDPESLVYLPIEEPYPRLAIAAVSTMALVWALQRANAVKPLSHKP